VATRPGPLLSIPRCCSNVRARHLGTFTVHRQKDGIEGETFGFRMETVDLGTDADNDPITTLAVEHSIRRSNRP